MIRFFAPPSTLYYQISEFLEENLRKQINGFDFRGTVWFRGKTENYLNCYNSRNICHSEERFSVLESPSHALSDDMFGGLKLENFDNFDTTFL